MSTTVGFGIPSAGTNGTASPAASILTTAATLTAVTYPRGPGTTCVVVNKTGVPDWYVNRIVRPYEDALCANPAVYAINSSYLILINRTTGEQTYDYTRYCWNEFVISGARFQAVHYNIFYGIPFPAPQLGYYNNWYVMLIQYLSLYCAPIAVTVQVFGLRVMRNVLKQSDSAHLTIFHVVLVAADVCLYLVASLSFTGLGILLVFPGCLSYYILAQGVVAYSQQLVAKLFLDQIYCFANLVQALLAIDRVFAVFFPVDYRVHATARASALGVVAVLALNTALSIFELIFMFYHGITIFRLTGLYGSTQDWISQMASYGAYLRLALYVVAYLAQLGGCLAIFLKIRYVKANPVLKGGKAETISLLPCYLLVGTCCINLFGTVVEILAFCFRNIVSRASLSSAGLALLDVIPNVQQTAIPLFNNAGMWVHFVACRQYRAEAQRLLAPVTGLLRRAFPCCCRGQAAGVVVPLAEASSSSGAFVVPTSSAGTASTSARSQQSTPGASMASSSMADVD